MWLKKNYKAYQLDAGLLISYFEFQFSRYAGIKTPYGRNTIMFNWLVGPKAQAAWVERQLNHRYVVSWRCKKDFRLKLTAAFATAMQQHLSKEKQKFLCNIPTHEEPDKLRFYNTIKGFAYCAIMTTMYHPQSSACMGCKYAGVCKQHLQETYPIVAQARLK